MPEVLTEGWRLRLVLPPAAAARSAEAWETPPTGTLVVLPACTWVEKFVMLLPVAETLVEGVGMLRVLTEESERGLLEGVGCVAPVILCVGFGSEMSIGRSEAELELAEDWDVLLVTEADLARRAVSSRVRRLTCPSMLADSAWLSSVIVMYHCLLLLLALQIHLCRRQRAWMPGRSGSGLLVA